ncbi:MAG TPA: hypothetical protein VES38_10270 [Methylotenera sp.]|nr:hypothetical protein [Methylotenera sp.]
MRSLSKKWLVLSLILISMYPIFVLSYVWRECFVSDLEGGKSGQLDAYRHTLASAVVAYTSSPKVVDLVTACMERQNRSDNLMDRHNNLIGAKIGLTAKSFSQINTLVRQQVSKGTENAIENSQITWLARPYWRKSLFW